MYLSHGTLFQESETQIIDRAVLLGVKPSTIRDVAAAAGLGFFQSGQGRQVSTMSSTSLMADSGTPAAVRIFCVLCDDACHHRMCNIRTALWTTPGLCDLRSRSDRPRLKLPQAIPCASPCVDVARVVVLARGASD